MFTYLPGLTYPAVLHTPSDRVYQLQGRNSLCLIHDLSPKVWHTVHAKQIGAIRLPQGSAPARNMSHIASLSFVEKFAFYAADLSGAATAIHTELTPASVELVPSSTPSSAFLIREGAHERPLLFVLIRSFADPLCLVHRLAARTAGRCTHMVARHSEADCETPRPSTGCCAGRRRDALRVSQSHPILAPPRTRMSPSFPRTKSVSSLPKEHFRR